jgi:hypothetical protein
MSASGMPPAAEVLADAAQAGWMHKQSRFKKTWNRRFFVLWPSKPNPKKGQLLFCFDSDTSDQPREMMPVVPGHFTCQRAPLSGGKKGRPEAGEGLALVSVTANRQEFLLASDSADDTAAWFAALRKLTALVAAPGLGGLQAKALAEAEGGAEQSLFSSRGLLDTPKVLAALKTAWLKNGELKKQREETESIVADLVDLTNGKIIDLMAEVSSLRFQIIDLQDSNEVLRIQVGCTFVCLQAFVRARAVAAREAKVGCRSAAVQRPARTARRPAGHLRRPCRQRRRHRARPSAVGCGDRRRRGSHAERGAGVLPRAGRRWAGHDR